MCRRAVLFVFILVIICGFAGIAAAEEGGSSAEESAEVSVSSASVCTDVNTSTSAGSGDFSVQAEVSLAADAPAEPGGEASDVPAQQEPAFETAAEVELAETGDDTGPAAAEPASAVEAEVELPG